MHPEAKRRIVLEPEVFYLLLSAEGVSIPPSYAAEMLAYDPTAGELRTHYAGFFDPGFGYSRKRRARRGSRAALEVRARDVSFMVEHGQPVCKLAFERMAEEPDVLYGEDVGSNYQGQQTMLSKHFLGQPGRRRRLSSRVAARGRSRRGGCSDINDPRPVYHSVGNHTVYDRLPCVAGARSLGDGLSWTRKSAPAPSKGQGHVHMPRTSSKAPKASASAQEPAWSIPSLREPRYSQSLERGLAILGCFTPKRPVLGIADIADELGMSRSTTHRYVITLLALGYLEQGASRKYRLGLRVTDLGMSALNSTGLREHAHPYLEELRQRTSYTASLAVLDGTEVLYVDRARSFRRGQGQDRPRSAAPARACPPTAPRWASCCSPTCPRPSSAS